MRSSDIDYKTMLLVKSACQIAGTKRQADELVNTVFKEDLSDILPAFRPYMDLPDE